MVYLKVCTQFLSILMTHWNKSTCFTLIDLLQIHKFTQKHQWIQWYLKKLWKLYNLRSFYPASFQLAANTRLNILRMTPNGVILLCFSVSSVDINWFFQRWILLYNNYQSLNNMSKFLYKRLQKLMMWWNKWPVSKCFTGRQPTSGAQPLQAPPPPKAQ